MTDKSPKLLVDALGAIDSAHEFVEGIPLDGYTADKMRRSAVERQLEILGEACARLAKFGLNILAQWFQPARPPQNVSEVREMPLR